MPADRAGRRAGRIDQDGVERPALPRRGIGPDDLGVELQPREILPQPLEPRRRAVDGGDLRAGERQLRGLAAGRGAEIGDGLAARRRRAAAPAGPRRRPAPTMRPRRSRAAAGSDPMRWCAPCRWRARGREASRPRLAGSLLTVRSSAGSWRVRRGDGARRGLAVVRDPALHQPVRRVEQHGVERGEAGLAVARELAQHRVDEAGIVRGVVVGLRQPHRQIDGGVVRHVEKQDLRRADQQDVFDLRRRLRQALFKHGPRADGASVPSRRSTVATMVRTRRAVALGQRAEIALLQLLVERPLLPQHAADDVGGDAARGETGRRLGRRRRRR